MDVPWPETGRGWVLLAFALFWVAFAIAAIIVGFYG